jgi:hypothetical protein
MKHIITLCLLLSVSLLKGQNLPAVDIVSESGHINNKSEDNQDKISGSIYLNDEWVLGAKIHTVDGNIYYPKSINFNVKLEQFVINVAKDSLFTLKKTRVSLIEYDSKAFVIFNNKYYERLSDGELTILKDYYLTIKPGAVDPISKSKISEDQYLIKSRYYSKKGQIIEELRVSKKNILKLLSKEKINKIKGYIKENNYSVKNDLDLKKILNYYNSL